MWLKVDGFVDKVKEWWQGYDFRGSPSYVLFLKLKALKKDFKVWSREVFGDLSIRKSALLIVLVSLDDLN